MNLLVIFGGAGGVVAALSSIAILARGIFRQISATEDNTAALKELSGKVNGLQNTVGGHETRIAVLEDRRRNRW